MHSPLNLKEGVERYTMRHTSRTSLCIHRPADKLRFLLIYAVHWPWREWRNERVDKQKLRHAAIKREKDKRVTPRK